MVRMESLVVEGFCFRDLGLVRSVLGIASHLEVL